MQLAAERIVIAVLEVVGLGVRVRGCANILEIRFRQRTLIRGQRVLSGSAGAEEDKGDERRENGEGEVTTLGVGQGGSPAKLLTVIHTSRKSVFGSFCPQMLLRV